MQLRCITVTPSDRFRRYGREHPRAPGVTGALSFTCGVMQALWDPREHACADSNIGRRLADGPSWPDLYRGDRGQAKTACERTECIEAVIDLLPRDLISVRVNFFAENRKHPLLLLVSEFRPEYILPAVTKWSNLD